jgi:hypothetical protein
MKMPKYTQAFVDRHGTARFYSARPGATAQRHADWGRGYFIHPRPRGDATVMDDNSVGGNDTLIGSISYNDLLYGDALIMLNNSHGGNDTLRQPS